MERLKTHPHFADRVGRRACHLPHKTGKWYGKVSGSMVENHILFMKNVRFPQMGKHTITLNQGMRDAKLNEVVDVGLTIKNAKPLK